MLCERGLYARFFCMFVIAGGEKDLVPSLIETKLMTYMIVHHNIQATRMSDRLLNYLTTSPICLAGKRAVEDESGYIKQIREALQQTGPEDAMNDSQETLQQPGTTGPRDTTKTCSQEAVQEPGTTSSRDTSTSGSQTENNTSRNSKHSKPGSENERKNADTSIDDDEATNIHNSAAASAANDDDNNDHDNSPSMKKQQAT